MTDNKTLVDTIKEHIPNPAEMIIDEIIHMFIQWYNRRILIFSSLIMITIPLYMISIGIIYFHSCPKSFYIPLHMIICGITSLIAAILLLIISIIWKRAIKYTSKITFHTAQLTTIILSFFEIIINLICLSCLILLTIIVINISNTVELINQVSLSFCHPIIYYSSYTLLFFIYSILSIIMIILFLIFHQYHITQK
ncbi:unnamed protein product [Adineta steineri]|uniref:Uncharacterized protein n=1 Tax=Adineta steineri TaxID=433720 RepID=A0A818ZX37_9BILA|nr:unnamed protein product [Adineta steineri]CAF1301267.1 unnamed protein product [Adineta steineri]CAF3771146.1 unnamed protein product [Adineta steineri]